MLMLVEAHEIEMKILYAIFIEDVRRLKKARQVQMMLAPCSTIGKAQVVHELI